MQTMQSIRGDENLSDRVTKFANFINQSNNYRISLRVLCDIGLVNHPIKLNTKIICT